MTQNAQPIFAPTLKQEKEISGNQNSKSATDSPDYRTQFDAK